MTVRQVLAAVATGAVVVVAGVAAVAQDSEEVPAPAQDILLAEITEDTAVGPVPGRQISFVLQLAAEPVCAVDTPLPRIYGFLLDADSDPATSLGAADPAWDDLGVEARVAIDCAPDGQWQQFAGYPFDISDGDDTWTITITAPVESLPTPGANWIAFAQDGTDFWRTPQKPEVGRFVPAQVEHP